MGNGAGIWNGKLSAAERKLKVLSAKWLNWLVCWNCEQYTHCNNKEQASIKYRHTYHSLILKSDEINKEKQLPLVESLNLYQFIDWLTVVTMNKICNLDALIPLGLQHRNMNLVCLFFSGLCFEVIIKSQWMIMCNPYSSSRFVVKPTYYSYKIGNLWCFPCFIKAITNCVTMPWCFSVSWVLYMSCVAFQVLLYGNWRK